MRALVSNSLRLSGARVTSSRPRPPSFVRTIRFRLSVWYSSLLLVFGVAFIVALNVTARFDSQPLYQIEGVEWQPVSTRPGGLVNFEGELTLREVEDTYRTENLERLQRLSIVAVVGLAIASGVAGYVLSGMLLRPIRDITEVAAQITGSNLGRRINHQGPDDELKALADTFDSMIGRIEESFDNQRQFVQDASHELRTPLAAMRTNIEVAEMDDTITPDEMTNLLSIFKSQTERLTRLSDDLLLLTTSGSTTLEPEPTDVGPVVEEVVRQLSPVAMLKDINLQTEAPPATFAMASGDLLFRCVLNLVDNAIKYSTPGSTVRVKVRHDTARTIIEVADNGPGIAADDLQRIFDRFYRVDKGRSRRQGGSGLGLAIVQEIMHSMNGTVSATSVEGHGATFTLALPMAAKPSDPVREPVFID